MKNRVFVFRISKGNEGGNPIGSCPMNYSSAQKKISSITPKDLQLIDYENNHHLDFILDEFWNNKVLRQGWGIEDTDLRLPAQKWIENYMISGKIYWNENISCNNAKGRWNVLRRMLDMNPDDFLLIPKTSSNHLDDYSKFVICQVDKEYYFDYPSKFRDFGHCINVKNVSVFDYSNTGINRMDFSSPYLWAVTEVKKHHGRYNKFVDFISKHF